MSDDLPPTPEGRLIRRARERAIPKLTIRAAASRAGMSAEQWGYVERGYVPSRGGQPPRRFSPPAPTLARMASTLSVTPGELESEGQRPDAAETLREMLRPVTAEDRPPPFPEPPTAAEEAVERFPGDLVAQAIWRQPNTPEAERWEMIATLERKRREIQSRKSQAG